MERALYVAFAQERLVRVHVIEDGAEEREPLFVPLPPGPRDARATVAYWLETLYTSLMLLLLLESARI